MIERRPITSETEWLEWRKQDVTASVVGALFGCHPYTTELKEHLAKRGVAFSKPDDRVLRRGRWLEPAVAKAVGEKCPGWKLEPAGVYLRDPDLRLGGTPDFFIHGDPRGLGVLQTKTVAPSLFEREWDDGREPPLWITLQVTAEMMLAGANFGAVAALVVDPFDMDVHVLDVPRHAAAETRIATAVSAFWLGVAEGREPQADFSRDGEAIRAMTRRETVGKVFDASGHNSLPMILSQRASLKARIKADEDRCAEIENEVKVLLGDAVAVENLPGWRVSFKQTNYGAYTVAARTARVLRVTDKRPAAERPDGIEGETAMR